MRKAPIIAAAALGLAIGSAGEIKDIAYRGYNSFRSEPYRDSKPALSLDSGDSGYRGDVGNIERREKKEVAEGPAERKEKITDRAIDSSGSYYDILRHLLDASDEQAIDLFRELKGRRGKEFLLYGLYTTLPGLSMFKEDAYTKYSDPAHYLKYLFSTGVYPFIEAMQIGNASPLKMLFDKQIYHDQEGKLLTLCEIYDQQRNNRPKRDIMEDVERMKSALARVDESPDDRRDETLIAGLRISVLLTPRLLETDRSEIVVSEFVEREGSNFGLTAVETASYAKLLRVCEAVAASRVVNRPPIGDTIPPNLTREEDREFYKIAAILSRLSRDAERRCEQIRVTWREKSR